MQAKTYLPTILSALLSFILNLFYHHNLLAALLNSLTLSLSVYFFQSYLTSKKSPFNTILIISLGTIPLFYYKPTDWIISLLSLSILGFFYLYRKYSSRYLIIIGGLILFLGNLYSGGIIKYPIKLEYSQLIFHSPEINFNLEKHQQDALFIPYQARLIVYSKLIYIYALLTNLFNFLTLINLADILLIANLYPFFIGISKIFKLEKSFRKIFLTTFSIAALTIGIDRSTDKFQSLYLLGPIFIILILIGAQTINKKKYIALWFFSLFLLISTKI